MTTVEPPITDPPNSGPPLNNTVAEKYIRILHFPSRVSRFPFRVFGRKVHSRFTFPFRVLHFPFSVPRFAFSVPRFEFPVSRFQFVVSSRCFAFSIFCLSLAEIFTVRSHRSFGEGAGRPSPRMSPRAAPRYGEIYLASYTALS